MTTLVHNSMRALKNANCTIVPHSFCPRRCYKDFACWILRASSLEIRSEAKRSSWLSQLAMRASTW
eukprot:735462-Rhodomonas_salina.1